MNVLYRAAPRRLTSPKVGGHEGEMRGSLWASLLLHIVNCQGRANYLLPGVWDFISDRQGPSVWVVNRKKRQKARVSTLKALIWKIPRKGGLFKLPMMKTWEG